MIVIGFHTAENEPRQVWCTISRIHWRIVVREKERARARASERERESSKESSRAATSFETYLSEISAHSGQPASLKSTKRDNT